MHQLPGAQSWHFCPVISLALAVAERARGVLLGDQEHFWMSCAGHILQALSGHFQSLPPVTDRTSNSPWSAREHLPGSIPKLRVPHIVEALGSWAEKRKQFSQQTECLHHLPNTRLFLRQRRTGDLRAQNKQGRVCWRASRSDLVPGRCSVQFCAAHCSSRRRVLSISLHEFQMLLASESSELRQP